MNELELKMIRLLGDLKRNYGVFEVKAEFEAEASRIEEVMRLKDIAEKAGLGIVLKIGGPEAITDMFEAQHIGVTGLVAPMIETAYAMKKYLEAVDYHFPRDSRRGICFGVNLETFTAYTNLREILAVKLINIIDKVTLGRVDLTGSLGIARNDINSDRIYKIAQDMFEICKKKGFRTAMGGGIAKEAIPFIKKLAAKKLLDYFETRKIVFRVPKNFRKTAEGIVKANQFELLWLQNKKNYYAKIYTEDDKRIKMLKTRTK